MTVHRITPVGLVVDDLAAEPAFFLELGFQRHGEGSVEGDWVDRIVGLEGVHSELVMLETPDGQGRIELSKFLSPPSPTGDPQAPPNAPGLRHLALIVDDIDAAVAGLQAQGAELVGEMTRYRDSYRLCYVRGPAGIIVELAEPLG